MTTHDDDQFGARDDAVEPRHDSPWRIGENCYASLYEALAAQRDHDAAIVAQCLVDLKADPPKDAIGPLCGRIAISVEHLRHLDAQMRDYERDLMHAVRQDAGIESL